MPEQLFKSYALVGDADNRCTLDKDEFEDEVEAEWYSAAVPRKEMKALMKRTNREATFHFILWGLLLIGSGVGSVLTWGTWWTVPFLMLYGIMYSMSDHQAHELSHGTPFRIRWLNDFLYWVNGFMTLHETYYWRWSHTRHHTDTLHVGRDPEIAVMAPADLARLILDFVFLVSGLKMLLLIFKHSFGKIEGDGVHFIPDSERRKVIWNSRAYVAITVATVIAAVIWQSWLPILLVVTPRFYGGFFPQFFNITQHAGLKENCQDHRQNCRTFYTNPVFEFLYMKMNYHIEHHMFPMVPFHRLPALHAAIKDQCPPVYPSVWACYREMIPAIRKQLKDPHYFVERPLPNAVAAE
ncbi:MAG: fatty acid desaturase [Albidovulum sp.]|nr:fatty acid desaturase [Albidovulum sp.]